MSGRNILSFGWIHGLRMRICFHNKTHFDISRLPQSKLGNFRPSQFKFGSLSFFKPSSIAVIQQNISPTHAIKESQNQNYSLPVRAKKYERTGATFANVILFDLLETLF